VTPRTLLLGGLDIASLREEWKQAKAAAAKKGVEMTKISDKANFGPLLDKYEAEEKAYDAFMKKNATNPDDAKEKAAKKKVVDAANAAVVAAGKYAAAITQVEKQYTGATKTAAASLSTALMKILVPLHKASAGNF